MRIKNRKIRKFVIRLNKISFLSAIFNYFIKLILGNKLYRSIVTKGFSQKNMERQLKQLGDSSSKIMPIELSRKLKSIGMYTYF